jgi:hypothetical protein
VTGDGPGIMAKTDASGHFQLAVPPGRVTLRAMFDGFRSFSREFTAECRRAAVPGSRRRTVGARPVIGRRIVGRPASGPQRRDQTATEHIG